jgi:excisionase family DNA binding protein
MGVDSEPFVHERLFDKLQLLTVSEVCTILRCHEKTLYHWVKKGRLSAIRVGSRLKFDPADVAAFITSRRTSLSESFDLRRRKPSIISSCSRAVAWAPL